MFQHPPWWKRKRPDLSFIGVATAAMELDILAARLRALGYEYPGPSDTKVPLELGNGGGVILYTPFLYPTYHHDGFESTN